MVLPTYEARIYECEVNRISLELSVRAIELARADDAGSDISRIGDICEESYMDC